MTQNTLSRTKLISVISLMLCGSFIAKGQDLPMDRVNALLDPTILGVKPNGKPIYPKGIIAGRYMEDDIHGHCSEATFPNWDGFPLQKCAYNQPDKNAPQTGKTASVIMLNPEQEVLAKWLVASCVIVKGSTGIKSCTIKLAKAVIGASGSQFAVAGIVLEDINPEDKIQEAYTFRDGVTVKVQDGLPVGFAGMFGENENKIAIDPDKNVLSTASTRGPARIQSTTRQMYRAYMGSEAKDVTGIKWLDVVRELYQDAWRRAHNDALPETIEKYRNDLMVARCYFLMGITPPQ